MQLYVVAVGRNSHVVQQGGVLPRTATSVEA